jgi:hypothetical protein
LPKAHKAAIHEPSPRFGKSRAKAPSSRRGLASRIWPALLAPALLFLAGCGGSFVSANSSNTAFSIAPGGGSVDTNCTGCNAAKLGAGSVEQFSATLSGGGPAEVVWSVSGGDPASGPGVIRPDGQYTPPSYLTADRAEVQVTAVLQSNPDLRATSVLTVTPGFLQPLTPENVALGANGSVTVTGILAEAGGAAGIRFALSDAPDELRGGQGTLSAPNCQRSSQAFTSCSVTYTAPAAVQATGTTYVVATVGASQSKTSTVVLVNAAGIGSNPATHQGQVSNQVLLGSSGGNNTDYDAKGSQIVDCCSGTLGALVEDSTGRHYLLSNNHVLARSDHASMGDTIVQPGLIDNNCTPLGDGPGVAPVASLSGWLPLGSKQTNADAAIAQVASRSVSPEGSILELGYRQADGTLSAAPPGISSTAGKGESAWLDLKVAKSGRTTGLTCGSVSALDLDITVDYFLDCAETKPYLTKTFTHQLAVSGNAFSDAGDSGALVVDAANAEPVGLYFAGGKDSSGVSQAVASPASDVLGELGAQHGNGIGFSFVGAADHPVSCLNYGDNTIPSAQGHILTDTEIARGQLALGQARMLVYPSGGILGVATGKSLDRPGEAAVLIYTDENMAPSVPATVAGVRTLVIPTSARAVALGAAPENAFESPKGAPSLSATGFNAAQAVKQRQASTLMKQNPAFFGVGVGQSLDNPRDAALVIYVDRKMIPPQLPRAIDGLRTRYIVMDRLHVTRSYATPFQSVRHCSPHTTSSQPAPSDPFNIFGARSLPLN